VLLSRTASALGRHSTKSSWPHGISLKQICFQIDGAEMRMSHEYDRSSRFEKHCRERRADGRPNLVGLFCGVVLLASLCMAALGVDISGTIF
jgi:hypothetical protein